MLTFKVGYATIRLRGVSHVEANNQDMLGRFSWQEAEILIRNNIPPALQASVLVHELIHACFAVYNLQRTKLTEEDVCSLLDGPITALFTDNPELEPLLRDATIYSVPLLECP